MTSCNDGQRERRSDKPLAEEIAPQSRPCVVQDPYTGVTRLGTNDKLQRTIDRETFFEFVRVERSMIFRIKNLQGAKKDDISLMSPTLVSTRTATHQSLYA